MKDNIEIKNKEELIRKISKEKYGDEYFIKKAILSYKTQQEKTYTFFRDDSKEDLLRKYNWCQRPNGSNMSLDRFLPNGEIEGHMSESLAKDFGLTQIDLNEFIFGFVKPIIKELETYKKKVDILENKVHYKICENCNKEYRTKRSDTKYCKECAKKVNNSNWYSSLTDKKKQERREKSKLAMRKYRAKNEVLKDE